MLIGKRQIQSKLFMPNVSIKGEGKRNKYCVGVWMINDAREIAKELRSEGFTEVTVRGRGTRKKYFEEHPDKKRNAEWDYLPVEYATYGSVYISGAEWIE